MEDKLLKWRILLGCGVGIALIQPSAGITLEGRKLLSILVAIIVEPLTDSGKPVDISIGLGKVLGRW